jgi:peptidylprolyl isomerase
MTSYPGAPYGSPVPAARRAATIHYTMYLPDGGVINSHNGGMPFRFVFGTGQVIPGIEETVRTMRPGETRRLHLNAANAFGPHIPQQIVEAARHTVLTNERLSVGQPIRLAMPHGLQQGYVRAILPDSVVFDLNHPLAGVDLVVDVMLVAFE